MTNGDVEAILAIEQQLARAWVAGDRSAIDAILGDDWSVTDAGGQVLAKNQVMSGAFESDDRRVDSMTIDEVRVRMFGDVAVATGRTRASGRDRGASASVVLRFTDVFVHRAGRWQAVASHASLIADDR